MFVYSGLLGLVRLWQPAQALCMTCVQLLTNSSWDKKSQQTAQYISLQALKNVSKRQKTWLESNWGITRMTQFHCTSLDLLVLVNSVSLPSLALISVLSASKSSFIYKGVFCLCCQRKTQTKSRKAIVSSDPEQRAFCPNKIFAKHPFAVLAYHSSPTADLVSGGINTTAVDSFFC